MSLRLNCLFMLALAFAAGCGHSDGASPGPAGMGLASPSGVMLNWLAPSEYEDGSFLGLTELDEFRVYVDQKLVGIVEPHVTRYFLELPTGKWEVALSSVAGGIESLPTQPVFIEIPAL